MKTARLGHPAGLVALALSFVAACTQGNPPPVPPPIAPGDIAAFDTLVTVVEDERWQPQGRSITVQVLEMPPPPGVPGTQYTLTLSGDSPQIELTYSVDSYTLEVGPDTLLFSGHPIEVTSDPEVLRIDGVEYTLARGPVVHVFIDGQLAGGYAL